MIGVVDYGLGNIEAFLSAFTIAGIEAKRVQSPSEVAAAGRLVLPGVGAFDTAMKKLQESGMLTALHQAVLGKRVPVLGVCVGMQMMFERSDEGVSNGLGWISGTVTRLPTHEDRGPGKELRLPHMGWNSVQACHSDCDLLEDLDESRFYFLHSYSVKPVESSTVVATTNYGSNFVSVVRQSNCVGTQFHPEKSHESGIRLLANFAGMTSC